MQAVRALDNEAVEQGFSPVHQLGIQSIPNIDFSKHQEELEQ